MADRKIYFVFVNFNDAATTISCIESINQITNVDWAIHIVVIDNASKSDDFQNLAQKVRPIENVKLYRSEKNLGYFGGLNLGISKIGEFEDAFVIIGNNDLLFPQNFLTSIQHKNSLFGFYPVVSPNIITLDGVHQNPHVIKSISRFREFVYDVSFTSYYIAILIRLIAQVTKKFTDRKDELQHDIAQTIYQGYGACYILGPMFFKYFKSLWAPTFLMNEELFLSKQLESKGLKLYYEPSIIVKHALHATMGKLPGRRKWEIERESRKTYRKYLKNKGTA